MSFDTKIFRLYFVVLTLVTSTCSAQPAGSSQAENLRFDLAGFVKRLMPDRDSRGHSLDYLALKQVFGSLQQVTETDLRQAGPEAFPGKPSDFFYIYATRIPLYVRGRHLTAENMPDERKWKVYIAGPRAMPTNVYFVSEWPVAQAAGASYFSSQGLAIDAIACERLGGSDANYTALYRVAAPGKRPLLLRVEKSTGSGGIWYRYELTWFSVSAATLPREAEVGLCQIKD
jgi:hypothetical protein